MTKFISQINRIESAVSEIVKTNECEVITISCK